MPMNDFNEIIGYRRVCCVCALCLKSNSNGHLSSVYYLASHAVTRSYKVKTIRTSAEDVDGFPKELCRAVVLVLDRDATGSILRNVQQDGMLFNCVVLMFQVVTGWWITKT